MEAQLMQRTHDDVDELKAIGRALKTIRPLFAHIDDYRIVLCYAFVTSLTACTIFVTCLVHSTFCYSTRTQRLLAAVNRVHSLH